MRMGLGEEGLCRKPHLGGDSRRRRNWPGESKRKQLEQRP